MSTTHDTPEDWTDEQSVVFSRMFRHMLEAPTMFQHPEAPKVSDEHWQTTCWNAAWFAALCAGNSLPLEHVDLDGATMAVETTVRSMN